MCAQSITKSYYNLLKFNPSKLYHLNFAENCTEMKKKWIERAARGMRASSRPDPPLIILQIGDNLFYIYKSVNSDIDNTPWIKCHKCHTSFQDKHFLCIIFVVETTSLDETLNDVKDKIISQLIKEGSVRRARSKKQKAFEVKLVPAVNTKPSWAH